MAAWNADELSRIGGTDEIQMAARRRDGSLHDPVTIWVVRDGDDLYVRSYRGEGGAWFRNTRTHHEGHISAGGVEKDITLVDATDPGTNTQVDAAYRTKYSRFGAQFLDPMVAQPARSTTMRLVPR